MTIGRVLPALFVLHQRVSDVNGQYCDSREAQTGSRSRRGLKFKIEPRNTVVLWIGSQVRREMSWELCNAI